MKILQLNCWSARLEKQVIDLINEERPDIVCLQEAISLEGSTMGIFAPIQILQKKTGLNYSYFSPTLSANYMRRKADFGNAVLSKHSFSYTNTVFTGRTYIEDFDSTEDDYNIRNLQHITIALENGETLHVLNHHGHHIHQHKNGDAETLKQCRQIVDYITPLKGKIILTGDFNLAPTSESIQQINAILTNLCVSHNLQTTRNELTPKNEVCDYIFINQDVYEKDFKVAQEIVSDHSALILTFK